LAKTPPAAQNPSPTSSENALFLSKEKNGNKMIVKLL
jgi:hypothetical protein